MRVFLVILDSVGIGALPDSTLYGDEGSNTLANTAKAVGGLSLPFLRSLGLGNIAEIKGVPPTEAPQASFGKMQEVSPGKDTTTGHWEMMGVVLEKPFPTYPHGFPVETILEFERIIGRKILGNYPASGTLIIEKLGKLHMETGRPIVYTSADSVFQIAAHEEVVPLNLLYQWCITARKLLQGENGAARVIARPFKGTPGAFERTPNRRDFALPPPIKTVLEVLKENGVKVLGLGKIEDIFCGRGLTSSLHAGHNREVEEALLNSLENEGEFLVFANLVDFDMVYGHRNDPQGYSRELSLVDGFMAEFSQRIAEEDLVIITADHGCDPTTESTDHSREYVPLLAYGRRCSPNDLGTRKSFSDIGKTLLDIWEISNEMPGESFLHLVLERSQRS